MTVGITFGAWDLCHAGHIHFLRACSEECDKLIVGLHTNPFNERPLTKEIPVQSVYERFVQVVSVKGVGGVVPYDTEKDLKNMLATISDLDYYFLGSDYLDKPLPDEVMKVLKGRGIQIKYIPRLHDYSSTELRKRIRAK